MGINYNPSVVTSSLILNLDAGNPNSYPGTTFPNQVEYLIVAGGGGGGGGQTGGIRSGGGGGGGGVLTSFVNITPQSYTITVGLGGTAGTPDNPGSTGQNSTAFGITTLGGGGGGGGSTAGPTIGGSGGGGSAAGISSEPGAAGIVGQGTAGGNGTSVTPFSGGGGGGGGTPGSITGGGRGLSSSITGTAVFYAGGGGGGNSATGGGTGGQGGGGNGGGLGSSLGSAGSAATANTGGGGGGAGGQNATSFSGGTGGSGIVIVRYPGAQQATGGTVSTSGGFTTHTFTASGTFAPLIWSDVSGRGNNATLVNSPTFSSANSGSLVFNGTSQWANLGNVAISTSAITVSAWVFDTDTNNFPRDIVTKAGTFKFRVDVGAEGGNLSAFVWIDGTPEPRISAAWTKNVWTNVAFVWNSSGTFRLYINGVVRTATTSRIGTAGTTVNNLSVAADSSVTNFWPGNISDVMIYNATLTDDQIAQNFQALRGRFGV